MQISTAVFQSGLEQTPDGMAPFSLPPAFQRARCMTSGQLTPPPSPDETDHDVPNCFVVSKSYQMSTTGHPRKLRSIAPSRKSSGRQHVSSRTPSCSSRYSTEQNSPVRKLTTKLFSTPVTTSEKYHASDTVPSIGLRRVSHSYDDLRSLALEHERESVVNIPITSPLQTPLLPSPIIDDRNAKFDTTTMTSFRFENPRHLTTQKNDSTYKSYDDMQILSCYEDSQPKCAEDDSLSLDKSNGTFDALESCSKDIDPTLADRFGLPLRKVSSQSSVSGESDWLANTKSHEQRLRKFKARCYQVVQHPFHNDATTSEDFGKVMLATVLVGHGKARLVQVRRPPSSTGSLQSSKSSFSHSHQSLPIPDADVCANPSTPVRQRKEISAFSPYDTPSVNTSIPRQYVRDRVSSILEQTPITASKLDLLPQPLNVSLRGSSTSDETNPSATKCSFPTLEENFPTPNTEGCGPPQYDLLSNGIGSHNSSTEKDLATSVKLLMFRTNLEAITTAIETFPNPTLNLGSSVVLRIRSSPTEQKNKTHLYNLSRVFPEASQQLLSLLAAWLIIDCYISNLQKGPSQLNSDSFASDKVSSPPRKVLVSKRSASLGLSDAFRLRPPGKVTTAYYKLFPSPPKSSRSNKDPLRVTQMPAVITDPVPVKAQSILGMNRNDKDDQAHRAEEQILMNHAKLLSVSIAVIAQKLVEVLKGEDCWDPYLWRALSVVVNLTEDGNTYGSPALDT